MNLPGWPFVLSPVYHSYPYEAGVMLNCSVGTSLNSSSGYESGNNDTSLIECGFSSTIKTEPSQLIDDYDNDHRKKRRILSCPQRHEANRRERYRMEIINEAYEQLRNVLPFKKGRNRQKMSRMYTVDGAIQYIQSLLQILHGPNYNTDFVRS